MEVWTIVVAAGSGSRFGRPKQFELLAGRRVLDRSVEVARSASEGVVVVLGSDSLDEAPPGGDVVVVGGPTRSASVRAGLAAVPATATVIVVHDAARPLASVGLFTEVVATVGRGAAAAVPGAPVIDTVRWRTGGVVDRDELVLVQTPQAFAADALRAAHADGVEGTDDASLVERCGYDVVVVAGEPTNLKITTPVDLAVAEALLASTSPGVDR